MAMNPETKTVKERCKCEHCGNEAEMIVTCSLPDENDAAADAAEHRSHERVKGTAVCTHCGNEAEMWVDL